MGSTKEENRTLGISEEEKTVQALKCIICLHQHDVGCAEEKICHREGCQVKVEGRLVLQQARAAQDQQGSQVAWEL